jgi:hypothetical protein
MFVDVLAVQLNATLFVVIADKGVAVKFTPVAEDPLRVIFDEEGVKL